MENPNEKSDQILQNQTNSELFEKSREIKKKNALVQEKLRTLKKESDQLLKTASAPKP